MRKGASFRSPADPAEAPTSRERSDGQVEFAPTRVREGRRSLRPLLVAAMAVTFVGLAVVKPWDAPAATSPPDDAGIRSSPPSGPLPTVTVRTPVVRPTATLVPAVALSPDAVAAALVPRDAWGIRAVVEEGEARLAEQWAMPAPLPGPERWTDGRMVADHVLLPTAGDAVRLIGVTGPGGAVGTDVRVWRITEAGTQHRLMVRTFGPAGHLVAIASRSQPVLGSVWPPGTYRLEALVDGRPVRLVATLPARRPG